MNKMIITISRLGDGLAAQMDQRFGRAERFLVVDADTGEVLDDLSNQTASAAHGAGTGSASLMKEQAVSGVISGRYGPKAFETLQALGIDAWIAPPGLTAGGALDAFRAGTLELMELKIFR